MKVKATIETLVPYRSNQIEAPIVLNANETRNYLFPNGFPVQTTFQKYPNTNADDLRDALAERFNLSKENFIIGNGSTDLLELSVKTFTEAGDYVLTFDPSFAMYDIYSQIHGVTLLKVASEEDNCQNMETMIQMARTYAPSLIFVCTPNNPTGVTNSNDEIIRLLTSTDALVIVDEAYIDFLGESESMTQMVNEFDNLIVARTFSKAYGLAAIRLGYMVANESIINTLLKVKLPYSVNSVSVAIGLEALSRMSDVNTFLASVISERQRLYRALQDLPITVYPSAANFLFIESDKDLQQELLDRGILIRSFRNGSYRITVGTQEENTRVIDAFKEVFS